MTDASDRIALTPETRVHDLISDRPYLIDRLITLSPQFRALKNPLMRNTLGRVATLRRAAGMGDIGLESLLRALADEIRRREQVDVTIELGGEETGERESRRERLKSIILSLHAGEDMESAKERFQQEFASVPASEIATMEQQLISEGLPAEMIQELCDVHVGVMGASATGANPGEQQEGHPVFTFVAENIALKKLTAQTRTILGELDSSEVRVVKRTLETLAQQWRLIREIEKHYLRKENLLFPKLEAAGFTGPSQVMWAIHDEIRSGMKEVGRAIDDGDVETVRLRAKGVLDAMDDMVTKEEVILLPTAIEKLEHEEWADIHRQEEEIGFAFVERGSEWSPRIKFRKPSSEPGAAGATGGPSPAVMAARPSPEGAIPLRHGELTQHQLNRILLTLPVELSFVDEDDEVRYVTGLREKIFPRTPAVIGRKVQNCHPPKSLHLVNRILDGMKEGTRETAEFWMDDFHGRFIHIRYDAVRDEDGSYMGCLEAVQDITSLRGLEGSRRLLDEQRDGVSA